MSVDPGFLWQDGRRRENHHTLLGQLARHIQQYMQPWTTKGNQHLRVLSDLHVDAIHSMCGTTLTYDDTRYGGVEEEEEKRSEIMQRNFPPKNVSRLKMPWLLVIVRQQERKKWSHLNFGPDTQRTGDMGMDTEETSHSRQIVQVSAPNLKRQCRSSGYHIHQQR